MTQEYPRTAGVGSFAFKDRQNNSLPDCAKSNEVSNTRLPEAVSHLLAEYRHSRQESNLVKNRLLKKGTMLIQCDRDALRILN